MGGPVLGDGDEEGHWPPRSPEGDDGLEDEEGSMSANPRTWRELATLRMR